MVESKHETRQRPTEVHRRTRIAEPRNRPVPNLPLDLGTVGSEMIKVERRPLCQGRHLVLDFDDQTVIVGAKADPQRGHGDHCRQHDDCAESLRTPKKVEKADESARKYRDGQRQTGVR
ncbi:hypothetical protein ACOJVU_17595 [Mycobacterium sp. THU-M104]|uniref:hypothetical protein n=1 Tax=Mycobacterium sp. THU-M104 TaxID=3410515 RepID=UPI003B98E606